jgi:hypothetical protein
MSRQSEPADDSDVVTPEGAGVFARALQNIARLNGISARRFNWRHGSIASRIEYLLKLTSAGGGKSAIDRPIRRIKIALWIALAVASAAVVLLSLMETNT